ncbi:MAG: phosphopyruvate hydratase [Planctomycetota bacterium]|nr:phosphopyruvate hydratase [Planctomycetota bacterium]
MASTRIQRVHAREVFDSRGRPTVEVEIACEGARPGRAIVPSGASTGAFEALELRDGDAGRLQGLGVRRAVELVNSEVRSALIGQDATDQQALDQLLIELDGTLNKSRLGANAILGASLAAVYATAEATGTRPVDQFRRAWLEHAPNRSAGQASAARGNSTTGPGGDSLLPLPMVNMISGGKHAGGNLDFQDYLILPVGATSYPQAFEWIVTVYQHVGQLLTRAGFEGVLVGDEGGFGPKLASNEQALDFVVAAIEAAGLRPGEDVGIGLDVASSHFHRDGIYRLIATGDEELSASDVVNLLEEWVNRYPIVSIEDGLDEDDWHGWKELTQRLGNRVQLIGDDLFVTNPERLQRGIDSGVANSVLIKLNQIGTLTETLRTLNLALQNGYWPVVSARSGETEDTTIADLVVATGAGQLKVGSVARSERLAKYNQLLRLSEGDEFGYLGGSIFQSLRSS